MICLDNPLFMLLLHSVWIRKLENKHGIVILSCLAYSVLSCSKSWFTFQRHQIPHYRTVVVCPGLGPVQGTSPFQKTCWRVIGFSALCCLWELCIVQYARAKPKHWNGKRLVSASLHFCASSHVHFFPATTWFCCRAFFVLFLSFHSTTN